jgi:pimeloyl-ACP methyl ester carboxylesterase
MRLNVERFALYLHDFGSQIGLRLAINRPERIAALIIQNGDIYEDELGPKYAPLHVYFRNPTRAAKNKLAEAVSENGFKDEFLNDVGSARRTHSPTSGAPLVAYDAQRRPDRRDWCGSPENPTWFPRYQGYLRDHRPPTLIVWGPRDGYMPEGAARAYLRDLPDAELHLLDGGHWLLETHLAEVVGYVRDFLGRVHAE